VNFAIFTLKDYQQDSGRLHIRHGKGNKARFVYAGIRSQKAIWRYLLERDRVQPSDTLFASKTDNALHHNNLRHTFAIEFLRNGGNVFELKKILGMRSWRR
jgi:site-specific recombinase XerD